MVFDFKKEHRALYIPTATPSIVTVPPMNYAAVCGTGDPNEAGSSYQQALSILYAISYTLKMEGRKSQSIAGFFDYVVPPLEGLWWQDGCSGIHYSKKHDFHWISMIRLPDFVSQSDFAWAVMTAEKKKSIDCSQAMFLTLDEGLCVQIMHTGPYDDEPASIVKLESFAAEKGYAIDITPQRRHHEIYLSDPRKTAPAKLRTVIRHPIRPL